MTHRQPGLPSFFDLVALDSIDSTNDEARRRAAAGAPAGTLVWAREQTAGRGRRGRSWHSPAGNLYLSLILQPGCRPAEAGQLGFVAAVALAETLAALLPEPERIRLKWPNDVLVEGRKISGILLETAAPSGTVILGMGVNVGRRPQESLYPTASLLELGLDDAEPAAVLEGFAPRFLAWYETWRDEGFAAVRQAWLSRAVGLGESIVVRLDNETVTGRFAALDESGALALELPEGRRLIAAGDVFFTGA
jgi:BirA family biotin operon repressor/biotin-[acetyl-CoA-carboxylase] ligase